MPRKKKIIKNVEPIISQSQIGELIVSSFEVNSNKTIAQVLQDSHDLELNNKQIKAVIEIVKNNTTTSVDAALNQLIQYYE
jgi:hypothetical protein